MLILSLALTNADVGTGGGNQGGYPVSFLRTLSLKLSFRCCRCNSSSELNRAAELAARTTQFNTAAPQPREQALALLEQLLASGGEVRTRTFPIPRIPVLYRIYVLPGFDWQKIEDKLDHSRLSAPNFSPGYNVPHKQVWTMSGEDRFGDHGVVGAPY